jgi:hypothetical protein
MVAEPAYFSAAWWNFTYFARGLYAEQLERWLGLFPERLLVLPTDDLAERPGETYLRVLGFLGVPARSLSSYPRIFVRDYAGMSPETRRILAERYAEPNRRLYELLGRDLGWS